MKHLLYDTDLLGDDLLALAAISRSEEVSLEAVTVYGRRIGALNRARIAQRFLDLLLEREVDIVPGSDGPLMRPAHMGCRFCDEIIEQFMASTTDSSSFSENPLHAGIHAAEYLVKTVRENPGKYSLLCTGPLTNLALAASLDPSLPGNLAEVVIMGGLQNERGNSNAYAESNMFNDPEAAEIFFTRFKHVTVVGLDVTLQVLVGEDNSKKMGTGIIGSFLGALIGSCCKAHIRTENNPIMPLHDVLAFYVLEDPTFVRTIPCSIHVETVDAQKIGQTCCNVEDLSQDHRFAIEVDTSRVLERFRCFVEKINRL